jgi:hypothetical protein
VSETAPPAVARGNPCRHARSSVTTRGQHRSSDMLTEIPVASVPFTQSLESTRDRNTVPWRDGRSSHCPGDRGRDSRGPDAHRHVARNVSAQRSSPRSGHSTTRHEKQTVMPVTTTRHHSPVPQPHVRRSYRGTSRRTPTNESNPPSFPNSFLLDRNSAYTSSRSRTGTDRSAPPSASCALDQLRRHRGSASRPA